MGKKMGPPVKYPKVSDLKKVVDDYFAKTDDFPGFNLLLYHGGSLIYYSENVPSIRKAGGQKAVNQTMKFLLQRRHLAPSHGSTLYIPDPEKDFLFIDTIPDFFITGHIHRANIDSYKNITYQYILIY